MSTRNENINLFSKTCDSIHLDSVKRNLYFYYNPINISIIVKDFLNVIIQISKDKHDVISICHSFINPIDHLKQCCLLSLNLISRRNIMLALHYQNIFVLENMSLKFSLNI